MQKKFGFTLIELLTVVMILAILTAVALPQYRKSVQRVTAANALINLKTIFDSAKRFKSVNSTWPTALNQLDVELLDVDANGTMEEIQYTLVSDGQYASACRVIGESADGAYCLRAYYRTEDGRRDVYTCSYTAPKYQFLCESLGTCEANSTECEIK